MLHIYRCNIVESAKVRTLAIALLTEVQLMTSKALLSGSGS